MENEPSTKPSAGSASPAKHAYSVTVIILVVGLAVGYLYRRSHSPAQPAATTRANAQPAGSVGGKMPTLEQMKQMADTKAAPLLEKLKTDPANKDLLFQVGKVYSSTHQFNEAAVYYDKALQVDPKDVAIRTELASCLYYKGDVDGAISQLQQALHYDPKDANSLFNLGMIQWQGKQDSKAAVATWELLLKSNPQLSAERKAVVQKLMADAQMQGKS